MPEHRLIEPTRVEPLARPLGGSIVGRCQQKPRRLNRVAGDDDVPGGLKLSAAVAMVMHTVTRRFGGTVQFMGTIRIAWTIRPQG
jgi:hypothetical protein